MRKEVPVQKPSNAVPWSSLVMVWGDLRQQQQPTVQTHARDNPLEARPIWKSRRTLPRVSQLRAMRRRYRIATSV